MQVVCYNNKYKDGNPVEGLTLNKIYYAISEIEYVGIKIVDDNGEEKFFVLNDFFMNIDQWREQQINKLIDES